MSKAYGSLVSLALLALLLRCPVAAAKSEAPPATTSSGEKLSAPSPAPISTATGGNEAEPFQTPPRRQWYGWQNLAVGLPGVGLLMWARSSDSGGAAGVIAGYSLLYLGSPSVHFAHGRVGAGFLGLGINLASTLAFTSVLPKGRCDRDDEDPSGETCRLSPGLFVPWGVVVGGLVGLGIDSALLPYEDVPPPSGRLGKYAPSLSATRDGISVGLSGVF